MKTIRRPMYNEEQKRAFIDETIVNESSRTAAENIFMTIAQYEEQWGMDIAAKPASELDSVLDEVCGIRTRSRYSKLSIIANYRKWCMARHIPGAHGDTPNVGDIGNSKIKSSLVRNPAHLQQYLDLAFDKEEEQTQDNVYRCFFWMAYGGMSEGAIHSLLTSDVNFNVLEASHGEETAILYRQGLKSITNCVRLTAFLYKNEAYVNKGAIWRNRSPGNLLLRGIRASCSIDNFRTQLSRKLKAVKERGISVDPLTYSRVWLSGVFYRIYEAEQAGIEPDFIQIAIHSPSGQKVIAGESKADPKTALTNIAKDFRTDYNRWKFIMKSL